MTSDAGCEAHQRNPKGTTMQNQQHYTVIVHDSKTGKLLGRLCPDGTATSRVIYAAMLDKEQADQIAAEINSGDEFTAKVRKF